LPGDSLLWALSDDAIWKYNVLKNEGQFMPLRQTEATSFDFMDDQTLLVGFKRKGLREFSLVEEKLTYEYVHLPDNNTSLLSNTVDEIYRDSKGNIWICSWGSGISYTQPQKRKFNTYYPKHFYPGIESFSPLRCFP
jgi:ligand-binding sensor domain-containing protein